MSGGERARLALALIVWQRPNLLLLDEPTNHLDLDMREALAVALNEFEGAMVLVSHDRHLLATAVDELHLVADGRVTPYNGDLDDYRNWLLERRAPKREKPEATRDRKEQRRSEAQARQALSDRRKPLAKRLAALEKEMAKLGEEKRLLEERLASPDFYTGSDQDLVTQTLRDQGKVGARLDALETEWLELTAELDTIVEA
jgi:ATP-binding cassette subfamily F protein 3